MDGLVRGQFLERHIFLKFWQQRQQFWLKRKRCVEREFGIEFEQLQLLFEFQLQLIFQFKLQQQLFFELE